MKISGPQVRRCTTYGKKRTHIVHCSLHSSSYPLGLCEECWCPSSVCTVCYFFCLSVSRWVNDVENCKADELHPSLSECGTAGSVSDVFPLWWFLVIYSIIKMKIFTKLFVLWWNEQDALSWFIKKLSKQSNINWNIKIAVLFLTNIHVFLFYSCRMRAPETIPLVMEPESRFYSDPVLVLDFQSLYPSMIIAYNYCFSTCLGRVSCLSE